MMSFYLILNIIIISFLIAFLINNFFIYNKTSYLLIFSIFIFNSISVLFFILELEFIAITFSMIYVGGIAVMFLFLILVVDVNIENVEGSKIVELKLLPCFIIALITVVIVQLLIFNFDAFTFNTIDFIEFVADLINFNFYINLNEFFIYNQLAVYNSIDL